MKRGPRVLQLDPAACDGLGYCAEILPELIALDEWGFPVTKKGAVPAALVKRAREAAASCPRRALRLSPTQRLSPTEEAARAGHGLRR